MFRRFFPVESNQYKSLRNFFHKIDTDSLNRFEIFFPMWIMFAFQHYLVKSYDSLNMGIDINKYYLFSMITEDLIGVVNIFLHSLLFLWLMKKFESFGPFRIVKMDSQTNFLLFLSLYAFIDIIIFGEEMIGLSLLMIVLYLLYRSDSFQIKIGSIVLTIIAMIFSINQNEPIISTAAAVYLPFLFVALIGKSNSYLHYAQKYLPLILFIFLTTKELWFGFIGIGYFLFFNSYYYFTSESRYNWLKFDHNY